MLVVIIIIIIIMYIYHALINALSVHMIHINLNMIFYTHAEHSPIKTFYVKYYFFLYTVCKGLVNKIQVQVMFEQPAWKQPNSVYSPL